MSLFLLLACTDPLADTPSKGDTALQGEDSAGDTTRDTASVRDSANTGSTNYGFEVSPSFYDFGDYYLGCGNYSTFGVHATKEAVPVVTDLLVEEPFIMAEGENGDLPWSGRNIHFNISFYPSEEGEFTGEVLLEVSAQTSETYPYEIIPLEEPLTISLAGGGATPDPEDEDPCSLASRGASASQRW